MHITDYLEKTAEIFGEKRAVTLDGEGMTFSELLEESKRIGSFLAENLTPGSPVPIYMEKCPDEVSAFFGAAYAGCFYSPISKEQPKERVMKILHTLQARTVVTDEEGESTLRAMEYTGRIFLLSDMKANLIDERLLREIRDTLKPGLFYVMFTSGSTGTPKGVSISQKSVIDFIGHFIDVTGISSEDKIGNQAPFDFDVSVKDIYSAIFTGAELVLIKKDLFSKPPVLMDYICDNDITTLIWAVPALCILSGMKVLDYRIPEKMNKIMFSGQAMPVKQLMIWKKALPNARYINLYGPTEVTCNCTYYKIPKNIDADFKLPIGNAFPGRKVFLLDKNNEKINEAEREGEIAVAGESLAEGYYNNPDETAKHFIYLDGERIYKTGDMAVLSDDGQVYFSGRADFQVKIMGHRIELEEIEDAILSINDVNECCCIFQKDKSRITAFITGSADTKAVKQELKSKLPAYMIPAHIKSIDRMPLTINGKIDRKKLSFIAA